MIVVDASAVVDLLLRTPPGRKVEERILDIEETVHVPHLLDVEVAQALRRYALNGELTDSRAREALTDLADLPLIRYPHTEFLARVWDMHKSVTAYDGVYAALAEALEAPLVTTDGKLARAHGFEAKVELITA
jgi:predicted nucleic acid-binding protein